MLQSIEADLESKEQLNSKKTTLKAQFERIEMEISEVKKRLNGQMKEITVIQKTITGTENRLEQKRSDRHSLLQHCKVNHTLSSSFSSFSSFPPSSLPLLFSLLFPLLSLFPGVHVM